MLGIASRSSSSCKNRPYRKICRARGGGAVCYSDGVDLLYRSHVERRLYPWCMHSRIIVASIVRAADAPWKPSGIVI